MAGKFGTSEMEKLAASAAEKLRLFFLEDYKNELAIPSARIATSTLSTFAKLAQTESARETTCVLVARDLTHGDQDRFAAYIKASMPNAPIAQLIEEEQSQKQLSAPRNKKKAATKQKKTRA